MPFTRKKQLFKKNSEPIGGATPPPLNPPLALTTVVLCIIRSAAAYVTGRHLEGCREGEGGWNTHTAIARP